MVGSDNASLALELVGYPAEVQAAMEYTFGNALVCKTSDMAKKITFSNLKVKTSQDSQIHHFHIEPFQEIVSDMEKAQSLGNVRQAPKPVELQENAQRMKWFNL